jgi:hypothetical protein
MTIRLDHTIVAAKDKVTSAIIDPHEQGRGALACNISSAIRILVKPHGAPVGEVIYTEGVGMFLPA